MHLLAHSSGSQQPRATEAHWRSLSIFNLFRQLTIILLVGGTFLTNISLVPAELLPAFLLINSLYAALSLLFGHANERRWPRFDWQLGLQVAVDVLYIATLMHMAGGFKSGLGLLVLPYLAAAGLIARGRMTLFHAALATIAILGEETWRNLHYPLYDDSFLPPALLCIASFAVAWLAHRLASLAQASQKLAEQRGLDLANLGQLNQRILQDTSEGVLVVDAENHVRQHNEQLVRLTSFRFAKDSPLGNHLPELVQLLNHWRSNPMETPELLELPGLRQTLRVRFVPIMPRSVDNILIYMEDMDRVRAEAQQIKLAALGRLTASLAHEIRNPLGAISHAAQLLGEETEQDALTLRLTHIINDNVARLDGMVSNMLELNRRDRVNAVEIFLDEWLTSFIEEFRQLEHITVDIPFTCSAPADIHFDVGHLHQVLWNLVQNGWRHCRKEPGSLQIHLHSSGEYWLLDVQNDGPSIDKEVQNHLFEPFFTTEARGNGLGLYIAREICQANDALIEHVTPPEGGACFRVIFGLKYGQKKQQE